MELSDKNLTVPDPTGTASLASAEATPTIVSEETESLILPASVALKDRPRYLVDQSYRERALATSIPVRPNGVGMAFANLPEASAHAH
jgi:hypothetical protein